MLRPPVRVLPTVAALTALLGGQLPAQEKDVVLVGGGRPRLGVMLETQANPQYDKYGAYIREVTPDGPAAKAGLQAADIVTTFNGVALGGIKGEGEESGPSKRLRELAAKLEAGDTVKLEYRRGNETRKAALVAADLSTVTLRRMGPGAHSEVRRYRVEVPDGNRMFTWHDGDGPMAPMAPFEGHFKTVPDGGPMGLELATVNAGLGEYFGTKSGALVLEVPADSSVQLRAGDVITAVDGRAVTSEEQAHRILRSYADGETAKLEVLRQKKKVTVSWKAPEDGPFTRRFKVHAREAGPGEMRLEVEKD